MENSDRRSITLEQEDLIKDVYAANPRTIVVLLADFPYAINWTNAHVPAIIQMSQNAQEAGTAIADVLFGDYNPAGRLVVTWPKSLDQLPPMRDYNLRHGRTYMYFKDEPLYPFGYGLSYTSFRYANLKTSALNDAAQWRNDVSVDVENSGDRAGDEVVQMYVTHEGSKCHAAHQRIARLRADLACAAPDQNRSMTLQADSLAYWDEHAGRFVVEQNPSASWWAARRRIRAWPQRSRSRSKADRDAHVARLDRLLHFDRSRPLAAARRFYQLLAGACRSNPG